jgi:hypothetical protein
MSMHSTRFGFIGLLLVGLLLTTAGCDDGPSSGSGDAARIETTNAAQLLGAAVSTGDVIWAVFAHSRFVLSDAHEIIGTAFDVPLGPCDSGTAVLSGDASNGSITFTDCEYRVSNGVGGSLRVTTSGLVHFVENESGYAVTLEGYRSVADSIFSFLVPDSGLIDVIEMVLQCDVDKRNCSIRSARFRGRDERTYSIQEPSLELDDDVIKMPTVVIQDPEHGWFTASSSDLRSVIGASCANAPVISQPKLILILRGAAGTIATVERGWCGDYEFCIGNRCRTISQP